MLLTVKPDSGMVFDDIFLILWVVWFHFVSKTAKTCFLNIFSLGSDQNQFVYSLYSLYSVYSVYSV